MDAQSSGNLLELAYACFGGVTAILTIVGLWATFNKPYCELLLIRRATGLILLACAVLLFFYQPTYRIWYWHTTIELAENIQTLQAMVPTEACLVQERTKLLPQLRWLLELDPEQRNQKSQIYYQTVDATRNLVKYTRYKPTVNG